MIRRTPLFIFVWFTTLLRASSLAAVGTGELDITEQLSVFYGEWVGPIAAMFAVAGLVFAFVQIGLSRGPDAFTNAIRWLVVVGLVLGAAAIVGEFGIEGATV